MKSSNTNSTTPKADAFATFLARVRKAETDRSPVRSTAHTSSIAVPDHDNPPPNAKRKS